MCVELRVKAKHLALEPAIIRSEEQKLSRQIVRLKELERLSEAEKLGWKREELSDHRRSRIGASLRNEARATHLARAFLAGKKYSTVEQKRSESNETWFRSSVIKRVVKMVTKYDTTRRSEDVNTKLINEWLKT